MEPWSWVWKPTLINSKFTSNSYRTQAIVSEWLQRFNAFKWRLNTIYKEFDPGSGRTLAARLTHASRTESRGACFSWLSGERVSNAWVTCLQEGDNILKRMLIPHDISESHDFDIKDFIAWRWTRVRLVSWWGNGSPRPRSVAGLRGWTATLGLRHGPDSYGRQQWGILRNGGNPDAATPREGWRFSDCKLLLLRTKLDGT